MQFGALAKSQHINASIYQMFARIDPADVQAFVRKFRSERNEQRLHTFRELIVGSYLQVNGLKARYEQQVLGKTPDWVTLDSGGQLDELVDVVSLHQRRETETEMLETLSNGAVWAGWVTVPPDHLYAKIEQKANRYAGLVGELSKPYTVFLFGEFLASVDPDEVEYVLLQHCGGLFTKLPTLAALIYFTESAGTYKFTCYTNSDAAFPSRIPPVVGNVSAMPLYLPEGHAAD